jgi:hypothetical protein
MHEKTKMVDVEGGSYQLRKMTPDVGGYIWQKLMQAVFKAGQDSVPREEDESAIAAAKARPAEDRVKGICALAFMGLSIADYRFVQNSSMKVVSRIENDVPMPVMADDGRWAATDIADNPFLVTKLMTETLAFNLSSFLS